MIINIGSHIIPPPLSRALKEKCLWMSYYESKINKTTTSAMRREESGVIIPCYQKRSARLQYNLFLYSRVGIEDQLNEYSRLLFGFPVFQITVRKAPNVWLRWNAGSFSPNSSLFSFPLFLRRLQSIELDTSFPRFYSPGPGCSKVG